MLNPFSNTGYDEDTLINDEASFEEYINDVFDFAEQEMIENGKVPHRLIVINDFPLIHDIDGRNNEDFSEYLDTINGISEAKAIMYIGEVWTYKAGHEDFDSYIDRPAEIVENPFKNECIGSYVNGFGWNRYLMEEIIREDDGTPIFANNAFIRPENVTDASISTLVAKRS